MNAGWRRFLLILDGVVVGLGLVLALPRLIPEDVPGRSVRAQTQPPGAVPAEAPEPVGYIEPVIEETKPDFKQPYSFVLISEQNLFAMKGFPAYDPVPHAATFNPDTGALYLLDRPERATRAMKGIVLTEVITPEALLFSEIHIVEEAPWQFAFPDLTWTGIHAAGPDAGREENMVDNTRREVRGTIIITEFHNNGSIAVEFGEDMRTLAPGESWVIAGAMNESRLVIHNFGRWNTGGITYGETTMP